MTDRASSNVLSTNVPLGHVPRCDNLCRPKEDGFLQSAWRAAPAVVTGVGLRGEGECGTAVGTTAVGWPTAGSCITGSSN